MSVNTMQTGWGQCIDAPVDRNARTGSSLRTPAARDGALCVFRTDTNQLFVHGGRETVTRGQTFTHSTMLSTTVDPLCPELAWSPVSAPNEGPARYGHAGTIFAPSGTVLIHGGKDSDGNVRPDVFLFKPFVRHDGDESDDDDRQRYGSPNSAQGSVGRNGRRHSKSTGGGSRSQSRQSASSRRSQSCGRGRSASSSVVSIPCPQCDAQNANQNQNHHQEDGIGAGENGATDPAQGRAASRASCLSCGTGLAANFTPLDVDTSLTAACADLYPSTKVGQWYRWDKFMCGVAGPMMYGHALYASHRSPAVVVVGPISGDRPSAAPANRRAPKRGRTANDSSSAVAASNGTVMNSVGRTTGVKANGAPLMKIFTIDLASDEYEWASVDTNNDPAAPTRRGFGLSECPYRPNSFYLVGGEVGRKMERLSDVWLHDGTVGWWREICSSIPMPGLCAAVHPGWGVPKIAAATSSANQSNAVGTNANDHDDDDDGAAVNEHGGGAAAVEDDVPPHEKVYEHLPLLVVTARGAGGVIDEIDTDPSTAGALRYDSSGLPTFSNVNAMSQSQSQSQSQYRSSVGVTATTSGTAGAAGSMRGGPSLSAPYSRDRVLPGVLRPTAAGSADGFRATLTADAAPTGHVVAPFAKCYKSVVQNVFLSEIREVVAPTTPQNEVARDGASGGQIDANGEGSAAKEDGDESSNSNPAATTAADQIGAGDTAAPTLKTIGNADAEGRSTDAALRAPEASTPAPSQDRSFVCDLVAVAKNGAVLFTTLSLDSVDVRKHSTSVHRTAVSNGMTLRLSTPIAHIIQNTTATTIAGQQYTAHSANATVTSTQALSAAGTTPMIGTATAVAVGGPSESISASTALRVGSPSQSLPAVGAFASAEPRPPATAMSAVVVGHQSSSASPALNVTSAAVPSVAPSAAHVDDASVARPSVSAMVAPSQFTASQGRVSALATQSEVLVAADDEIDVGSILF